MLENELIHFANQLADAAGLVIRPLFRTRIEVDIKPDKSPVTIADRDAERMMREMIMTTYPTHGIWGEEFGKHNIDAEYCWVLDPVDGTKSFIAGFPLFGTLISLLKNGKPIIGIIDQPINNERWLARAGGNSTLNGKEIHVRSCPDLARATISTTSPHLFNDVDKAKFEEIRKSARYAIYGHDCYAYGQVACGFVDVVMETGLKPHDFCALAPVVKNAGGMMTDWQGRELNLNSDGRVIACGDKKLHAKLVEMLG